MLPTHDIPAVRCEAAAPGVEVAVGAACMAREMGPPRRGEDCAGAFTFDFAAHGGEPARTDPSTRPDNKPGSVTTAADQWQIDAVGSNFPFREVTK